MNKMIGSGILAMLMASGAWGLEVSTSDDSIEVDTGRIRFALGRGADATLRWVEKDGKRLVDGNRTPLLNARLMESATYDGMKDFAPDARFLDAVYRVERVDYQSDAQTFAAEVAGTMQFEGNDRLSFVIRLRTEAGAADVGIDVHLTADGEFDNRFVRAVTLQLPLALEWRKRVAQGGDQGLQWDTRYYYEFPGRSGILPHPDRNEFRVFAVEQDALRHFRIWRAESASTPELTHQHGLQAAGWTSVYDREGGVLFALREMPETAPKTLEVMAAGSGEARVRLHPESAPAFAPANPGPAGQVFNRWHATTWIFYRDEHPAAEPDRLLADLWQAASPLIGRRPTGPTTLWEADLEPLPALPADAGHAPYVRGGLPFARGTLTPGTPVALTGPQGDYPVQTQPLAFWPDGSVKWLHVVFALGGARAQTDGPEGQAPSDNAIPFQVTRREGEPLSFALHLGTEPGLRSTPSVTATVLATDPENGAPTRIRLDTGRMTAEFALGEHWMPAVAVGGQPVWREGSGGPTAFVDFLQTGGDYRARTTHPTGEADPGPVSISAMRLEESGPLRAVIRLEGRALSAQPSDIVMRVEAHADRSCLRLSHTVEFTRHDPRTTFLQGMGLRFPIGLQSGQAQVRVGGEAGVVSLAAADGPVLLQQQSPMHYRLVQLGDQGPRPIETRHRAQGWMDVRDADSPGMTLALRDMWQSFPTALSYCAREGALTAWMWPATERMMDVRRYSNYPHPAQGESTGGANNHWVETHYYGGEDAPNDPFAGTSRTHELLLQFHADALPEEALAAVNADFQRPPLIYAGANRYRATGVTLPLPAYAKFPNLSQNLDHFTDFWLFHQRYWNWYGIWDFGDVQHRFRGGGYGWKIDPERLKAYLALPPDERGRFRDYGELTQDYYPQQDWLFDNGRWGWTNTEGLPGLYFQQEYLRTGRRDVFFMAEALARHARDVVTRQSGRFFGMGTRHGVQHWSDGNHEERQTTFAEYRLHYYLTGEGRSREVMHKLSDYYTDFRRRIPRRADHSARIYGLFTRWEMTADPVFGDRVRDYLHAMIVPEGLWNYIDFRMVDDQWRPRGEIPAANINTRRMFFHNFGAMHGVFEYFLATGDEALRAALVRSARATLAPGASLQQGSASLGLLAAFGALHDETDDRFRELILADMSKPGTGSRDAFRMVLPDPRHWTGDTASLSRQSPLCWFYMVNLPVIMAAVGEEPSLYARIWARFEAANARERPAESRHPFRPRPSWQAEYDDPALAPYFAPWRPPETLTEE